MQTSLVSLVRNGFSESDEWLHVLPLGEKALAFACYGALDAPEQCPAGSMVSDTLGAYQSQFPRYRWHD